MEGEAEGRVSKGSWSKQVFLAGGELLGKQGEGVQGQGKCLAIVSRVELPKLIKLCKLSKSGQTQRISGY